MYNPNENRFGDPPDQFDRPPVKNMSTMASASLACSIIGIVLAMFGWFSILLGAMGILLARLSRGAADRPCRQAAYSQIIGIISIIIGAVVLFISFRMVIVNYGSIQNYYNLFMEQYYNLTNSASQVL